MNSRAEKRVNRQQTNEPIFVDVDALLSDSSSSSSLFMILILWKKKKQNKLHILYMILMYCYWFCFVPFRSFLFSINVLGIDRDLSNSLHFTNCTKFHIGHFVALLAIRTFARYFARIGCVWVFISRRSQNRTNYTDTYLNGPGISHFRAKINMLNNGCNEIDTTIAWDACKCNRCAARQTWVIV